MLQFADTFRILSPIPCMLAGGEYYGTKIQNADDFAETFLRVAKVAVVPGTGFGAPEYVRWSYATSMDNIVEGLERLKKFLRNQY